MPQAEIIRQLAEALERHGMRLRGGFLCGDSDREAQSIPDYAPGRPARSLVLIGNAGPAMYRAFFAMEEQSQGSPNPLDGWTRRVIEPVARHFGARAVFPFGGPPWHPFQRWAVRAEGLKPSPLGILIHPQFGLWHAYRAALLFEQELPLVVPEPAPHPCDTCPDRPCLDSCPVDAVTRELYAVDKCASHVTAQAGRECRTFGCLARRTCPIGREYAYPVEAMAFHMAAFLRGREAGKSAGARLTDDS